MGVSPARGCGMAEGRRERRPVPEGKRIPFSADYLTVPADGTPAFLRFDDPDGGYRRPGAGPCRLRVVVALDVRENRKIEVVVHGDSLPAGTFDIRFAYALQPFDLPLDEETARAILDRGLSLRMISGEEDTALFAELGDGFLCPRLLFDRDYADPGREFSERLYSVASIQPFGWMEGCVLDGMNAARGRGDPRALPAIRLHLEKYFREGKLSYEDPRSYARDGEVYGIEGGLPFAVMAILGREAAPGAADAVAAFRRFIAGFRGNALIADEEFVSAEGSYTIAYPLAALAAAAGDRDAAETAIRELLERKRLLRDGGDLYLRSGGGGERTFRNWGRAYAWYLLGLAQSLGSLKAGGLPFPEELVRELRTVAEIAAERLTPEGLSHVFLGESDTGAETSASAGIAAAFALGSRRGFLDESFRGRAERTRRSLAAWLTPDGMLAGVSQSNKDGESLQRSGYRVISQMAMGLMANI